MRLGHLEVFARDPQRAKAFYRDLLGLEVTAEQAEGRFVWLKQGDREILLRPGEPTVPERYRDAQQALVIYTDDLGTARARFEEHGCTFHGTDGSPECLTFTSPDGQWFQLVDPGDH